VTLINGDATIKANFSVIDQTILYNLTITNDGYGTTTPSSSIIVNNGVSKAIAATPYTGYQNYQFLNWTKISGIGTVTFGNANLANTTVTIFNGDATIRANFAPQLGFDLNSWMGGSIYAGGFQWFVFPASIGTRYAIKWDDKYDGLGSSTCDVKVSAYQKDLTTGYFTEKDSGYNYPQIITAKEDFVYILVQGYSFSTSAGDFAIQVIPSPCTLTVTSDGNGSFTPLRTLTVNNSIQTAITATPNVGCQFVNWTQTAGTGSVVFGNANLANTTATITGGDVTIQANFKVDHAVQYPLTITNDGNGSTSPYGILTVNNGVSTSITAVPSEECRFINWTKTAGTGTVVFGDANSANTTVTVISGDATIRANFTTSLPLNTLTTGNIISANGSQWFFFKAIIGAKYTIGWDDSKSNLNYSCSVKVSAFQKDLSTAYFTEAIYGYPPQTITAREEYIYVQVQGDYYSATGSFAIKAGFPQNTLTVTNGGNGKNTPSGVITVIDGEDTVITATPNAGCQFVNWAQTAGTGRVEFGDTNAANTTVTISGGDATVRANFSADHTVLYTLNICNSEGGSTTPSGITTVYNGINMPITALPSAGNQFLNWTQTAGTGSVFFGDSKSVITTVTVTSGNATIRANFAELLTLSTSWTSGNITLGGSHWYYFKAIPGTQYTIKWDDANWGSGNYPCNVKVSAFQKDLATAYFSGVDSGYNAPLTITALEEYVYIQVQGYYSTEAGCFAIKVYEL